MMRSYVTWLLLATSLVGYRLKELCCKAAPYMSAKVPWRTAFQNNSGHHLAFFTKYNSKWHR